MANEVVDHGRRRFLTAATAAVGGVGVISVAVPFIKSWEPSARAKAAGAPVTQSLAKIESGQQLIVGWRSLPVFIVNRTKDQLSVLHEYVHIADVFLAAGVHTFVFTYPHADLAPGSGDQDPLPSHSGVAREGFTTLAAIALQPQSPAGKLIEVAPRSAAQLCGRPLEWIELVSRSG